MNPAANDSTVQSSAENGDSAAAIEVRHEPALARYTIWRDGEMVGLTDYEINGAEVRFTHTEVNPVYRHEGLASILVEFALDDVRERTCLRVVAQCPYVRRWINEHAEYQDLLTRGR
ncbi:GNAT family N-acetyltransferase [Leifsonia kafniensis]|uniref:GNAT family N-acetyltransferase n=1 Tax=Leifsonia kafniensis TaxID=475957 RepID=A0ABP7KLR4_9MICO